MEFVILDLEWNGAYSRRLNGFLNEIIEFGAVRTSDSLEPLDTFEALVRPQVGKKISGKIRTLTSITNEDLEGGLTFSQALNRFTKWVGEAAVLTWGTSDILTLIENCRYYTGSDRIPFLKRYADAQAYCEFELQSGSSGAQIGLSAAAAQLGVSEEELDHHRALDDSRLTLRCLRKVYDSAHFASFLQDGEDPEFYARMEFKTVAICDLNNPLIHRQHLAFRCEACGRRARRVGEWQLRNKSFSAPFVCRRCGNKFTGRVSFRLKYEGLVVRKKILLFLPPKKEETESAESGS